MIFYSRLSMRPVFDIAFSNMLEKALLMIGLYSEYAADIERARHITFTNFYIAHFGAVGNDNTVRRFHYRNAGYQYIKPMLRESGYRSGKHITWRMMHKTKLLTPIIATDQLPLLVKCIIDTVNGDDDMRELFFTTLAQQCGFYTYDISEEYDNCIFTLLRYHYHLLLNYIEFNNRNKDRAYKVIKEIEDYLSSIKFKTLCRNHRPNN